MTPAKGRAPESAVATATPRKGLRGLMEWNALWVIAALLVADLAFVVTHWSLRNDRVAALDLEQPLSVPSVLQWLELSAAVVLLVLAYARLRKPAYAAASAILGVVAIDDALELHERIGAWAEDSLALPAIGGLEAHDLGELAFGGFLGLIILILIAWAWIRSERPERTFIALMAGLMALLGLFGFVVDVFHAAAPEGSLREAFIGTVEDGGELIVATLTLAVVWWHVDTDPSGRRAGRE